MSKFSQILAITFLLTAIISCEKERKLPPVTPTEFVRYNTGITTTSPSLGGKEVSFNILFPKDYRENTEGRYPVIYMLKGYGEAGKDWSSWISRINQLEVNDLQPMIYIFPECYNTYYCNSYDGLDPYMDMLINDLVPFVDKSFRTIADREHRAVMGYSMGGFGAMALALKHPETFSMSVPLSMSFRTDEQYMTESAGGWDYQWGSIFGGKGQSGEARLTDYYKSHCPFYQFIPENKEELSKVKWFFHCGDDEEQLLIANDNLHVQLRDYGYEHEFRISDGGHSGDYWRNAARETLRWIQHNMNDGGEWTRIMNDVTEKPVELNDDGTFSSKGFMDAETKNGTAFYLVHSDFSADLLKKIISLISQSNSYRQYMILPCDINIKSMEEWVAEYTEKYEVGKTLSQSQVITFGSTGREVWNSKDLFGGYYFVDADLAEDESTITADKDRFYYIDQTDDSENYRDMNALYRACMTAIPHIDDRNFEYRMRNGLKDKEKEILLASESIADNLKFE